MKTKWIEAALVILVAAIIIGMYLFVTINF